MIHMLLANSILVAHFAFILFVVFGGLLVFYKEWILWLHIPAIFWGALIEFFGWICPLTHLENNFRTLAGQSGYNYGLIQHYLLKAIYPDGLTRQVQIMLGFGILILNLFVYAVFFKKSVSKKRLLSS